jgi:RNA polymerase sigma-70 factor (ECF subfamily)
MSETEGRTGLTPETVATYLAVVHRFAMVASPRGIEPEDIAQEAMVRILEHIDRFDERLGSLDGWMWRIVLNLARDAERAARRKHVLVGRLTARDRTVAAERSPESIVLDRVRDRDLLTAVRCLPGRYRILIGLRYGAGLRSDEIAELLGVTRMAVVKATRRALDRLRIQLPDVEVAK